MIRALGLRGAIAINVITMIGIGPLITIPLVLANLHGATALWAWGVGAVIAFCDGLAWAELGSLYPRSGGTYAFVRDAFGSERWGRLFAFLFTWQTVLSAPLLLASGYIGFAGYAAYVWPELGTDTLVQGIVASAVGVVTLVVLYRATGTVGAIGVALAGVAIATLGAVIAASAARFNAVQAFAGDPHLAPAAALAAGLGPALVITLYDYFGYGAACTIGGEVRIPARTLPIATIASIFIVGALYLALQVGVLGAIRWQDLVPPAPSAAAPAAATYVASTVVERTWGMLAARIVTFAILVTAFASTFGNLLGYARIPYAAATDGLFFPPFAHLHARGRFPNVALLAIGLLALPACFLSLQTVINALTAGLVIVQNVAQLAAVAVLRARGVRAPYRMWLYPLPAFVALAGWLYIFASAGTAAIAFGIVTVVAGVGAFVWLARARSEWPFVAGTALAALMIVSALSVASGPADAQSVRPTWGHATTVDRDGFPVFEVDGKPFFVYGAAFFYERLPRDRWDASMTELARLGINTLDVYVPWNWHELSDGDFDFDGRTSPRRDLDEVLRLARAHGFKILLRPGPVIRNEWRNGGYPAWLLSRPEYGMPQHDVLEGRYPPTATLQNAHSDDAAAQWLANATHLRYAKRWLQTVLRECAPDADLILAIALDDDQGAYIDNQTYPAPHFQAYLGWLRDVVHGVTGPNEPVFINTYQMKVTASSPVWAMGNWYQSDAYAIGEHDRAQLEFSTGLLHTRPHQPMMASEFQAGWLEQAGDIRPRPADPSNTSLAMATMIGMGVRGIVNFPAQDTLYPAGYEVPFANSFYAWDAALRFDGTPSARAVPTMQIGRLVSTFGDALAAARPVYDGAILYLGGSLRALATTNDRYAEIADATIAAQQRCRSERLSCTLVDPSAIGDAALARYGLIVVPDFPGARDALRVGFFARLDRLRERRGIVVRSASGRSSFSGGLVALGRSPAVVGIAGASFARSSDPRVDGFLSVANYDAAPIHIRNASVRLDGRKRLTLPAFDVAAHAALVLPVGIHLAPVSPGMPVDEFVPALLRIRADDDLVRDDRAPQPPAATTGTAIAFTSDLYRDGFPVSVLDNGIVRVVVSPSAGARAFGFVDDATSRNVFTTVGALRDDVGIEPPLSTTDRIAKYTHDFPAGMFNRPYDATVDSPSASPGRAATATFSYDAPDVVPSGARFERRLTLEPDARAFTVDESVTFHHDSDGGSDAIAQRAVSVTSLSVGAATTMNTERVLAPDVSPFSALATTTHVTTGHALGYYDTATHELATIAWRAGDVEDATIDERRYCVVVRLTLARGRVAHSRYGYEFAPSIDDARRLLAAADAAAQVAPAATRTR